MANLHSAITIILGEISIILCVSFAIIVFRYLRNHRHLIYCLRGLMRKINDSSNDKLAMLQNFLQQTCHYSGEQALETAAVLLAKETRFYTNLMRIYMNQDHDALATLDQYTEEVIAAYRDLLTKTVTATSHHSSDAPNQRIETLTSTIKELTQKNNDLADQIARLNHEMDVTVSEYTSVFHADSESDNNQESKTRSVNNPADSDPAKPASPAFDDDDLAQELKDIAANLDEQSTNPEIPLHGLDDDAS